ncbi:MAG: hypothetical protein PHX83_16510 [Acidobacteriia bacterium]|nr:hypothetical protein [Terriglobia bacterium]
MLDIDIQNPKPDKILSISPSRKAIGVALVDGVGVQKTWLFRAGQVKEAESLVLKAREWLTAIFGDESPTIVAIEDLKPKQATALNLALIGVIEALAGTTGCHRIVRVDTGAALKHVGEYLAGADRHRRRPTLRLIAAHLEDQCPEFEIHRPRLLAVISRDWERTWGLVAKAAAIGLHARDQCR